MKIVKNYKSIKKFDSGIQESIFNRLHHNYFKPKLRKIIARRKCVYIDSGANPSNSAFVFENYKWKDILTKKDVKFYRDFYSSTLIQSINRYINPDYVVFENSEEFKYISPKQLIAKIKLLSTKYTSTILICLDTVFLDFNKLKYSNKFILQNILEQNSKIKLHKVDSFKYVLEVN